MTESLRAAVVGCGDVSVVHLEAVAAQPGVALVAVCDPDEGRGRAVSTTAGVPWFADHRTLLSDAAPDVVHVCTPHDTHGDLVIDCLESGVPVIVEKPLAHTLSEGERVAATARAHPEVKVGVCFQNRYNVTSVAAHDLVTSGAFGRVLAANATVLWHRTDEYYRSRPWRGQKRRAGGGVLMNQAIHTLDLLQWVVGDVVGVAGHAGRYGLDAAIDVEDTATLVLDHRSGARSVLFATVTNAVDSPVTLEVVLEQATLFLRGDLTVAHRDGRVDVVAERRGQAGGRSYWGASHARLIGDFYSRLGDPEPFWIGPEQGLASLRVLDRLYATTTRERNAS